MTTWAPYDDLSGVSWALKSHCRYSKLARSILLAIRRRTKPSIALAVSRRGLKTSTLHGPLRLPPQTPITSPPVSPIRQRSTLSPSLHTPFRFKAPEETSYTGHPGPRATSPRRHPRMNQQTSFPTPSPLSRGHLLTDLSLSPLQRGPPGRDPRGVRTSCSSPGLGSLPVYRGHPS